MHVHRVVRLLWSSLVLVLVMAWAARAPLSSGEPRVAQEAESASPGAGPAQRVNLRQARDRAELLHETIHGVLQVVHRDFFRADEALAIPSRSLEDVFKELARSHGVQLRWMAVNAKAMDVDHEPKSEFEKQAAKTLASGNARFESFTSDEYQYAGSIRLSARCLKCHLPLRSSNEDRYAGILITMPIRDEP